MTQRTCRSQNERYRGRSLLYTRKQSRHTELEHLETATRGPRQLPYSCRFLVYLWNAAWPESSAIVPAYISDSDTRFATIARNVFSPRHGSLRLIGGVIFIKLAYGLMLFAAFRLWFQMTASMQAAVPIAEPNPTAMILRILRHRAH